MLLTLAAALAAQTTAAQPAPAPSPAPRASDHDSAQDSAIVVTGIRRNREDVLGGTSVLTAEELARDVRPTIGETLQRQPGVSATSFGPNASRPIIRGLGGERVRVLTDGIGSLDVSTSSVDHAVAINPLTADRIEVLRGPAALLFGSSAIGGVVNIVDSRIPRQMPEAPVHVDLTGTLASASDERNLGGRLDVPLGDHVVLHADGSWLKTGDLQTGGYILSKDLRAEAAASPDPEVRALGDLKGKLPNSAARSNEIAGGAAYIDGGFNIGVSIGRIENRYGVPVRYSLDPAVEAEEVAIDLHQTRADVRAEIPVGGFLDQVRIRAGAVRYRHNEISVDTGEIGSTFRSRGEEGRIEAVQHTTNGWGGGFGAQWLDRRVSVVGDEKYLPANRQRQLGLFALQNYETGPVRLEAGARIERALQTAKADADIGNPALRRKFTAYSGSLGGSLGIAPATRLGLNLSYSERAPSNDELFANGPHGGTQAFEIGNPNAAKETSLSAELSLKRSSGPVTWGLSLYRSQFRNFVYLAPSLLVEDDLPVYFYRQGRAAFTGFEVEARAKAGTFGGIDWTVDAQADYVRANIRGFGPAPTIPPLRIQGGIEGKRGNLDGRLEVEHDLAQRRNAPVETETGAFTLVNASLNWRPLANRPELSLGLQASNIFDVEARRHTSLLKDFAPIAGRDFRLTARLSY